jgi:hypothetical protein
MNFQLDQAVEILSQTPATVKSLLGNLSNDWVKSEADVENWSPFDIVGHLIHADETDWIPRAEIILAQGENPTFEPFDRYAMFEKSKGKTLNELLETFVERRAESLAKLRAMDLNEDKLKLKAQHPELGEVTLEQLLSTWAVHDLTHIRQLVTVLANKYAENVGFWREYLSILQ